MAAFEHETDVRRKRPFFTFVPGAAFQPHGLERPHLAESGMAALKIRTPKIGKLA
jgi:hypothetical protein